VCTAGDVDKCGKRTDKKSTLVAASANWGRSATKPYKREREKRFVETQAENVFADCLTDDAGDCMNQLRSRVRQARKDGKMWTALVYNTFLMCSDRGQVSVEVLGARSRLVPY